MATWWGAGMLLLWIVLNTRTSSAIEHRRNLIWAQSPLTLGAVSRLMAISGDPTVWVANRSPKTSYISAPDFTWTFKALGFHWEDQTLYWSESMNKKIQSLVLNGSTDTMTLFAGTSFDVHGITVDWLSQNLYFTDSLYNWIIMIPSRPRRPAYKIVVQDGLDQPRNLAIHPKKGYLFWSDWGARPRIEVSDLEGGNRRILVEHEVQGPRGLTIDYSANALYWVDSLKATVEVVQFNGQGRRVIAQEEGNYFFGIAAYKDFLFITERSKGMLHVYERNTSVVSFTLGNAPWDIIMYDESQQPSDSNGCADLACDHMCVYDPITGPKCICGEGYIPGDDARVSCKPSMKFVHPSHVYAIGDSICQYPANLADMSLANVTLDSQCFLEDRQGYMTLAFDARENMLYYFANNSKTISRIPLELRGKGRVLTGGTDVVNGMSLDWVAGNLYWTESKKGFIKVAKKSGAYQQIVLQNLINPWGIAVHPGRGKMYWTDRGVLPDVGSKIEVANLDGSGRAIIMDDNIGRPNHLYIDFERDYLYWSDSMMNHVRRNDLNTGRITVIYQQPLVQFYGLSIFKDYIIWTDSDSHNGIHVARMDKKTKVRGIIHPHVGVAADLVTFDVRNQPAMNNSCSPDTTKCDQLCLVTENNSSRCMCGVGYRLSADGFTCVTDPLMDNFLLVNDAYQKSVFQVNLKTGGIGAIDMKHYHEPIALAFDPNMYKIYWSDNKAKVLKEANIDGKFEKTVLFMNDTSMCDGLAADYVNRLLFYTDTGNNIIGVVSMRNYNYYKPIITEGVDQPRDIVVSPSQGQIYWSDWGEKAKIEMANMDGSGRETLVNFQETAWPNGLALDVPQQKLYWVDAHHDVISVYDFRARNITLLAEETGSHYFAIDVIGQYLYVADWNKNYLQRIDKDGGQLQQFGEARFTRLYGIKGFNSTEAFKGISVCVHSVCDHLCLPKQNNEYSCACAVGYIPDGPWCKADTPSNVTVSPTLTTTPDVMSNSTLVFSSSSSATSTGYSQTTTSNNIGQETTTSQQRSSETGSYITKVPPSMSTTTSASEMTSSDDKNYHIPTTVSPKTNISSNDAAVQASTGAHSGEGLKTSYVILIVAGVISLLMIAAFVAFFVRRKFFPFFGHGKLVEEHNPTDFYKITFPAGGDDVSMGFDSGIENPTFDILNDPSFASSSTNQN